jgi:hypothetical protein
MEEIMGTTTSKSGVIISENFRDNLIISKYDNQLFNMSGKKLDKMCSENSEDVLTWNVFKSLSQIDSRLWLPNVFSKAFNVEFPYDTLVKIDLWKSIEPPKSITDFQKDEGNSEIDIIIESDKFVWFIEAKYKSDISMRTTNNENRDQLLRNIDVGSFYSGVRDFYFSLLYFDEEKTKDGMDRIELYSNIGTREFKTMLPHRSDSMENIKGIGKIKWSDFNQNYNSENEFELLVNRFLGEYLKKLIM